MVRIPFCISLLIVMCGAVPGCTAPSQPAPAAVFHADAAHTGVYRTSPLDSLHGVRWQFETGGALHASPAVAGGNVYVGSGDGYIYATDTKNGTERWRFRTGGAVHASPAVADGLVVAGSYDGNVYALDAATGAERWRFRTDGERRFAAPGIHGLQPPDLMMEDPWDYYLSSPVLSDGRVFVGSGDGNVYALDAATGAERWRFRTDGVVHSSPAAAYGMIYVGSWDSRIYALDAATGAERWRFQTGIDTVYYNQVGIQGSPAVYDSTVYVGSRDAHVYALDARTGAERWRVPNDGSWVIATPAVRGDTLYYTTSDSHRIVALNRHTGATLFETDARMFVFSSPALAGDVLYVGTFAGVLLALDASTGTERWRFRTPASLRNEHDVILPDGTLNFSLYTSNRYEDQPAFFDVFFSVGPILASPVVQDGVVFVTSVDGTLYALE